MKRDSHISQSQHTNAALMARRRAAMPRGSGQTYEVFVDHAQIVPPKPLRWKAFAHIARHWMDFWDFSGRDWTIFAIGWKPAFFGQYRGYGVSCIRH